MGNLNKNSTRYVHSYEPNTNDLTMAMGYDAQGMPVLRVDSTDNQHTSKDRLRVSDYETVFFNTFQYNKETDVWDETTANGGASVHSPTISGIDMYVTNTLGSEVVRQTRQVMRYIPGRQSETSFAIRLTAPTAGIRRRFGMFTETDGFYFEDGGDGDYYCVIRSSTTGVVEERRVGRANWSGDKLDGNGPSGFTANPAAQQLVVFEYEWYGAGIVEFKFIIGDHPHTIHKFYHANILETVWCRTPFLPIRCEVTNTTGGQTSGNYHMYQGSNSVISDGNQGKIGIAENISSPIAGRALGNTTSVFYPVLSIRLSSDHLGSVVLPNSFQAATVDNTNIFFRLIKNGTLTNPVWTEHLPNVGFIDYDQSATAITGGTIVDSGYIAAGNQGLRIDLNPDARYQLGRGGMGTTSDTLTVAIVATAANKAGFAAISWTELR